MDILCGGCMELTGKQQRLFDYLQKKLVADGLTPSLREIADDLEVSRNAVAQLIGQLERKQVMITFYGLVRI